jgi:hypothetical protein
MHRVIFRAKSLLTSSGDCATRCDDRQRVHFGFIHSRPLPYSKAHKLQGMTRNIILNLNNILSSELSC